MADLKNDPLLQSKIAGTRETIKSLSNYGVGDAVALTNRKNGVHQLSGHYASIVPLAVYFSQKHPGLLANLKIRTSLSHEMNKGSTEAKNSDIWQPIKDAMTDFSATYGTDIITVNSKDIPKTVDEILGGYISTKYSGRVTGGGGGTTVFKRTLKILGHIFY